MSSRKDETEATKGAFLKTKLQNMARWVEFEIGRENLPADVIAGTDGRSELEVCMLAGALQANKDVTIHRDWVGMARLMREHSFPAEVQGVITAIRARDGMHDKFWRYVDLFVEVAEQ